MGNIFKTLVMLGRVLKIISILNEREKYTERLMEIRDKGTKKCKRERGKKKKGWSSINADVGQGTGRMMQAMSKIWDHW